MPALVFHLIPHTHWDREWYLPAAAFRARLVELLDDLVDRLEREPGLRSFLLDGQTVVIEDYLAVRPEREPLIRALTAAGRVQLGPWYVLADEQIPSGESLVRNLLAGAADAERLGRRSDVLYSPDAFGHPATLPDLANEFGLGSVALWRGLAGARDLYRWRGAAGGDVLLYHLPPDGYEIGAALSSGDELASAWRRARAELVPRAVTRHVAVLVGADHHWVHSDLTGLRDALAALEPGHEVRISRLDEFCAAAADDVRTAAPPAALAGELRWSYGYTWTLQGVHGTRAHLKRRNSLAELALERVAEPLVALTGAAGAGPALLRHAWRTLLRNQFHDSISGSVSDAVVAAMRARFGAVEAVSREVSHRALARLVGLDADRARDEPGAVRPRLVLWNPAVRRRGGIIVADLTFFRRDVLVGPPGARQPRRGSGWQPLSLRATDGTRIPLQILGRRVAQRRLDADHHYPDQDEVDLVRIAFRAPAIAGLGAAVLDPAPPGAGPRGRTRAVGRTLRNEFVEVAVARDGSLRLTDRRTGARFDRLLALESGGDVGDTYTYAPPLNDRVERARGPARVRVLAAGPLVSVLEARYALPAGRGTARLVVRLHDDSPLVHCRLEVDNHATDHRLRARLPLGLVGAPLVTGAQFGMAARMPVEADPREYPRETPVPTAPAHRVAAAAEGTRGLALFIPGFFEVEWTAAGDLLLTLFRAVGALSRGDLAARPGHAAWPEPTPLAQCLGPDAIDLALCPITAADLDPGDRLAARWEDAFLPLRPWWVADAVALAPSPESIALEGDGLVVSAVKPAEAGDGVVLRCVNLSARSVHGRWCFGTSRGRAWRVRADEREPRPAPLTDSGCTLAFSAPPHAFVTHRVL
ncbi:MAG TPA: glycoside hydrolase family 38 C-terminal domain-containing protein [Gemmatimonadales bacterium]|nr:glycoside hydrolase family 38 C-terminal domain-containing protein [Gemmatimonadales bacterium]